MEINLFKKGRGLWDGRRGEKEEQVDKRLHCVMCMLQLSPRKLIIMYEDVYW